MRGFVSTLAVSAAAVATATSSGGHGHHGSSGVKFSGEATTSFEFTCPAEFQLSVDVNGLEICTRTAEVAANTRCPSGFRKVGSKANMSCQAVQTATPVAVCPDGFIRQQNTCVSSSTSELEMFCPPGFLSNADGTCTKTEAVLASSLCPPGTLADATGACVGREITSASMGCPEGFEKTTTGCAFIETADSSLVCPVGFEQDGDQCTKVEITVPTTSCPPGTSLEAGQCTTTQTTAIINECPLEFEGPDRFGACTLREVESVEQFCPEGSNLIGMKCETPEFADFLPFCPVGQAIAEECQLQVTSAAIPTCPEGFSLKKSAAPEPTHHRRHRKSVVPEVEAICTNMQEAEVDFFCPLGFTDNGADCIRSDISAPVTSCPTGSQKFGTECVSIQTAEAITECAPDFTLNAVTNLCEALEFADINIQCPPGFVMSELTSPEGGMLCEKCNPSAKATANCSYSPGLHTCPVGFSKNASKECSKLSAVAPLQSCPAGFTATRTTTEIETPKKRHHHYSAVVEGETVTLACTLKEILAPIAQCPQGTTADEDTCVASVSVPKVQSCPTGFTAQKLMTGHPHHGGGGSIEGCSRLVTESIVLQCPEGAELSEDGRTCVATSVSELETRCPPGYVAAADTCERTAVTPALVRCPTDFILANAAECIRTVTEAATPTCPELFELVGNSCVFSSAGGVLETCPVGFTAIAGGCERETTVAAINKCPAGYLLQTDNTCEKVTRAEQEEVCPVGFSLERQVNPHHRHRHNTHEKIVCVSAITSEAESSCPAGFLTTVGGGCEKVTVVTPSSRCPAGSIMSKNGLCTSKESVAPEVACPEGFEMTMSNVRGSSSHHASSHHSAGMTCLLESTAEIEDFCIDGSPLTSDGVCIITRTVPVTRVASTTISTVDAADDEVTFIKPAHGKKKASGAHAKTKSKKVGHGHH